MIVGLFIAAVLVLMLAFTLLDIWTAAPSTPNYGLALVVEDPTEDDPMDAYLEQRAAGNGVLPAVVGAPAKIHPTCYDAYYDHQPLDTYSCCAAALAGAPR